MQLFLNSVFLNSEWKFLLRFCSTRQYHGRKNIKTGERIHHGINKKPSKSTEVISWLSRMSQQDHSLKCPLRPTTMTSSLFGTRSWLRLRVLIPFVDQAFGHGMNPYSLWTKMHSIWFTCRSFSFISRLVFEKKGENQRATFSGEPHKSVVHDAETTFVSLRRTTIFVSLRHQIVFVWN